MYALVKYVTDARYLRSEVAISMAVAVCVYDMKRKVDE